MAERALARRGMWLPVPDGIDEVTAAAVTNPGMAAWKTLLWEGDLLRQFAAGEISLDIDPEPLGKVEQVWPRAGSDRRVVFVP